MLAAAVFIFTAVTTTEVKSTEDGYYVSTYAGSTLKGIRDGSLSEALFNWPTGLAIDKEGNLYVSDYKNFAIRIITPNGNVGTVTGFIGQGYKDGSLKQAMFAGPDNIVFDDKGNLIVGDADAVAIRLISKKGVVTTISGGEKRGFQDGAKGEAQFSYPTGVAVDSKGNIIVADRYSHAIRKINKKGKVTTIAGNGIAGYRDGLGKESMLREPISVAVGPDDIIYVSDSGNNMIRKIDKNGYVSTYAGTLKRGHRDGVGYEASFNWPTGLAVDKDGVIFVCDSASSTIRIITPDKIVFTIAGRLTKGSTDGAFGQNLFNFPTGIAVDEKGNIFVADSGNNLIRKITKGRLATASIKY